MYEPVTEFDRYPDLHELVDRGGRPGITYMLALSENVAHWQRDGWELIARSPALTVSGPKGTVSMQLMGQGEPIPASTPDSVEPLFFIDADADIKTGLWQETKKDATGQRGKVPVEDDQVGQKGSAGVSR